MAKVKPKTAKSKTAPAAKPSKAAAKPAKVAVKATKPVAPKAAPVKPASKKATKVPPKMAPKIVAKPEAKAEPKVEPKAAAKQQTKLPALTVGIASRPHTGPMKIVNAELPPVPSAIPPAVATGDAPRSKMGSGLGNRPMKRPKIKKIFVMPSLGEPLIRPGMKRPVPLIASGPKAPVIVVKAGPTLNGHGKKTHLPKKELDRYREILTRKRAELAGDVSKMEGEALNSSSGSLSHTPQHMADQGSDAYDQSLSLGIAQVDRSLIREIDDALARIENQTFGLCEVTGKPINKERLDELPWTRFSIEAAREKERRAHQS